MKAPIAVRHGILAQAGARLRYTSTTPMEANFPVSLMPARQDPIGLPKVFFPWEQGVGFPGKHRRLLVNLRQKLSVNRPLTRRGTPLNQAKVICPLIGGRLGAVTPSWTSLKLAEVGSALMLSEQVSVESQLRPFLALPLVSLQSQVPALQAPGLRHLALAGRLAGW